jgi:hypothetical protein
LTQDVLKGYNIGMKRNAKIILGIVGFLILTPLLIYTNCGSVEETTQTKAQQNSDPAIHQKVFIDIAGEHIKENELKKTDDIEVVKPEEN